MKYRVRGSIEQDETRDILRPDSAGPCRPFIGFGLLS